MSLVVNILYSGQGDAARLFAEEMLKSGTVDKIRAEDGCEAYDYYFPLEDRQSLLLIDRWRDSAALDRHHKSEMMDYIAELRKKYKLKLRVERFISE